MKLNAKKVLVGMLLGVVIFIFVGAVFVWAYLMDFSRASGLSTSEIIALARNGMQNKEAYVGRDIKFLFLGLDARDDEFEKTVLTDTMMIGSLNTANGRLTTIPLPRDLWLPDLQTKINALYFYGEKNPETTGIEFTQNEIEKITGVKPEFTVVLNYLELPALIDALGGIEVMVEKSFEDREYPNPNYVNGLGGTPYITINFSQGVEFMDGTRALAYVRSRGSADPEEGSDTARSKRQMIVLTSLLQRLKSKEVIQNPEIVGALYRFWKEKVETTLIDEQAVSMALALGDNAVSIHSVAIPVAMTATQEAILVNPPISKYGLWVWEPRDKSLGELKEFFNRNLL